MKLEFLMSFLNVQEVSTRIIIREELGGKSGVYMIKCLVTGTMYVGSAVNLYLRLNEHRLGHQSNAHLQKAIAAYGLASFEFGVLLFSDVSELTLQEQRYLDLLFSLEASLRYNFLPSAGSSLGCPLSVEARVKMTF
jgi:group I intron endonuclease